MAGVEAGIIECLLGVSPAGRQWQPKCCARAAQSSRTHNLLPVPAGSDRAMVGAITTSGDVEMPLSGAGNGAGKQHSTAMGGPLEAV
jgi:hypothetical protein